MPESKGLASQREMLSLAAARVRDVYLRKPFFVDGALDLITVCRQLAQRGLTSALVRDGERLGLFTTTDLRDALLRPQPPAALAVREVAKFDLFTVHPDSELFEALWLMVRHRVHRLLVRDGDAVLGMLGQLDVVSFVANHSQIMALQIDEANSLAELLAAVERIDPMVALLYDDGIKIERIARLVGELNTRLFARLWTLVAPTELRAHSCLLVMGSEGRREQILKTDQDNALLLRDGYVFETLESVAAEFNAALLRFGYPRCPGNIMLTNALWRQPLAGFKESLRQWLFGSDEQAVMNLAIFLDARAVAGDAELLREARGFVHDNVVDSDAYFARFARAADQFSERNTWRSWFTTGRVPDRTPFDLKKLGTFPIVHGARALALQQRIDVLGTTERLRALAQRGKLSAALAQDLIDALRFLMGLKLQSNLRQRELALPMDNLVPIAELATLERDRLKDSLAIIKSFRQYLQQHFKFDAL